MKQKILKCVFVVAMLLLLPTFSFAQCSCSINRGTTSFQSYSWRQVGGNCGSGQGTLTTYTYYTRDADGFWYRESKAAEFSDALTFARRNCPNMFAFLQSLLKKFYYV